MEYFVNATERQHIKQLLHNIEHLVSHELQ